MSNPNPVATNELDAVNYRNGSKDHWRRRMWNVVREMTPSPKNAIVLYLPGSTNADATIAKAKGFDVRNMIAVEHDKRVAKVVRKLGHTVIDEDLEYVMAAWPEQHPVSVVVADLTCGLDTKATCILGCWLKAAQFIGSTLVLNVQRGRETGPVFRAAEKFCKVESVHKLATEKDHSPNHRGIWAIRELQVMALDEAQRWGITTLPTFADCYNVTVLQRYRSSRVWMDSVVIKDLEGFPCRYAVDNFSTADVRLGERLKRVRRRITAALATRTRRLNS